MSALAEATVVYALLVGLVCLGLTVSGRRRPGSVSAALAVVAVAALGVAVLGAVSLARGHRPLELETHVGYLLTAPLIVPAAAGSTAGDEGRRWSSAAFAVACLVLVVVLVRLVATSHA